MPPRRAVAALNAGRARKEEEEEKVPVKRQRMAPKGTKLPEKMPNGEILTDVMKQKWKLGKSIGVGGFGEIYLANNDVSRPVSNDAQYVVKIEPHSNGPLYVEMHFYHRVAKDEMIRAWQAEKRLDFLGMPKFIAFGSHEHNQNNYRFMVMERFGDDIQKLFLKHNKCFSLKTVVILARRIIDTLEFIHEAGYIHADIKGSNLLLGFGPGQEHEVYLVDFGLASLYTVDGKHKEFKEDPRTAHNGTIEFTSRDAHIGVTSRRSDLEILGYNMILWLAGKLPWEDNLQNVKYVQGEKILFMTNIPNALRKLFGNEPVPEVLEQFLNYIADMEFAERPDYSHCKKILQSGLKKMGIVDDGKLDLCAKTNRSPSPRNKKVQSKPSVKPSSENNAKEISPRKARATARKPCGLAETNRVQNNDTTEMVPKPCKPVVATSPSMIPTPAMLEVMERKRQKELSKNTKPKTKLPIKVPVPEMPALRTQPLRKARKAPSPRSSFSPELY